MSEPARPRGLGRGLSALLGESFRPDMKPDEPRTEPPRVVSDSTTREEKSPSPPDASTGAPAEPSAAEAMLEEAFQSPAFGDRPDFGGQYDMASAAAPEAASSGEGGVQTIPIARIVANPSQPRRHFDEADLAELTDSIRSHGVLQPILVRPAEGRPGEYEIVAGERRWRAAQRAGVHDMPAVVRALDDVEVLEIGIIENVQRADLNPIEEAHGYSQLIEKFGRTQQDIADVVGKSRPHIANMLRLLNLPPDIQTMVREGHLSAGHARAILLAPDPMSLARIAVAESWSVREIERRASQAKDERAGGPRATAPAANKDADTRALEEKIAAILGLSVTINHRGDAGGEVRITYKRLEQLDDICRRLSANH